VPGGLRDEHADETQDDVDARQGVPDSSWKPYVKRVVFPCRQCIPFRRSIATVGAHRDQENGRLNTVLYSMSRKATVEPKQARENPHVAAADPIAWRASDILTTHWL
jgi:hypothetical protein